MHHRRFDYLEASKVMSKRAQANSKIEFVFKHEIVEALGDEEGLLSESSMTSCVIFRATRRGSFGIIKGWLCYMCATKRGSTVTYKRSAVLFSGR